VERLLATLDSKTGKMEIVGNEFANSNSKVIGNIPGYFIIDGSIAALDYEQGLIYAFLQPAGTSEMSSISLFRKLYCTI
jgi:hypothetical protein